VDLYRALFVVRCTSRRSGMDHTVLPANYTNACLVGLYLRKHSPDGATTDYW